MASGGEALPDRVFRTLFESAPGLYLVLSPGLYILAVTDAYLAATMTRREDILGRHLFDVFPDNPDDADATGVGNLRRSLDSVLRTRLPDSMPLQKYDIRRPPSEGGGFEVRYWSPVNVPVLGEDGDVFLIIHRVEDVTDYVRLKESDGMREEAAKELRSRADAMEAELLRRAQEIVAARRSLAERRRSEERTQMLIEAMPDGVLVMDGEGTVLFANTRCESMFGARRDELVGRPAEALLSGSSEGDRDRLFAARRTETAAGIEMTVRRGDGSEFSAEIRLGTMDTDTGPATVAVVRDCTERRHAEEQLRRANMKAREQLLRLQLLSQITRAIAGRHDLRSLFGTVLGYLRDHFLVEIGLILHFDRSSKLLLVAGRTDSDPGGTVAPSLKVGDVSPLGDNGLRECVDGRTIHVPRLSRSNEGILGELAMAGLGSAAAAPLGAGDSTLGVLLVARRATDAFSSADCEFLTQLGEHVALAVLQLRLLDDLRRAGDDLREAQAQMTQQERLRAMGEMASGIAHDINNALGPITLHCEMLLEMEKLSERGRKSLSTVLTAAESAAKTIAGLRHFYRVSEDAPTSGPVHVNAVVADVVELSRPRWRDIAQRGGADIAMAVETAPDDPKFDGWEGDVRNALTNLVFNAVDAMPQGGRIAIRTATAGGNVVLEVEDSGTGMDERTRRRCLEPFFTTKGERGTGLGLAMVYGVMKRHGGLIDIDSEPGRGTTVRLSFPVRAKDTAQAAAPAGPLRPMRSLRILCVDDDDALRETLVNLLRHDGHAVASAPSGARALEECEKAGGFDAVITDLGMPGMDGGELAAALHARWPGVPVILLTGWGSHMVAEAQAMKAFASVLAKPPRAAEVRAALAKACR